MVQTQLGNFWLARNSRAGVARKGLQDEEVGGGHEQKGGQALARRKEGWNSLLQCSELSVPPLLEPGAAPLTLW